MVFIPTLNQVAYLFMLIAVGYIIMRINVLPKNSDTVLSKLENYLFIPALVLSTFMTNFKISNIEYYGVYFLVGLIVSTLGVLLAIILGKLFFKNNKVYMYGIAFSNFGFMGNAVVLAIFPELFTEYLILVLPLWIFIYFWGVPSLLNEASGETVTLKKRMKSLYNPMVIAVVVGAVLGLVNLQIPLFIENSINTLGSLMTPIAMIITGMTIAKIDIINVLKNINIYILTLIRLIIIPFVTIGILYLLGINYNLVICTVVALAMPLGLNSVIILNSYEKDITQATGMVLISHVLSIITIPFIFMIFDYLF